MEQLSWVQYSSSNKKILKMRELLYEFKSYINIYKTNKNNSLDLEYINIDGLFNYLS
jgi:hypothetical protein